MLLVVVLLKGYQGYQAHINGGMGSETAVLKDLVASEGPIELKKCRDPPNQCGAGNGCPPKGA